MELYISRFNYSNQSSFCNHRSKMCCCWDQTHIYLYTFLHTYIHVYTYAYIYIHTYISVGVDIDPYIYTHIHRAATKTWSLTSSCLFTWLLSAQYSCSRLMFLCDVRKQTNSQVRNDNSLPFAAISLWAIYNWSLFSSEKKTKQTVCQKK